MRIRLIPPLILAALLGLASGTPAHVGDEIYLFYELRDEDLARIDVTDGSVEDWLEVVGEPSLTASDFFWRNHPYDPSEVDFRIWLAWHQGSGTLWIAMERFDDLYFNLYDGEKRWEMQLWDSTLRFLVDGDHSGGEYSYLLGWECQECTPDQVLENNRQAQDWMAIAETPDGQHLYHVGASEWVLGEPYAAGGGGVLGESPATTVTEFRVTPFDDLIYDDEAASKASELYPGKIIGFGMITFDNDDTQWRDGYGRAIAMTLWGGISAKRNADLLVDGLLVGAGEDPSRYDDGSAVAPSSWARIKAALK